MHGYNHLRHYMAHRQLEFRGKLQALGDRSVDRIAQNGAKAIYEQHLLKSIS